MKITREKLTKRIEKAFSLLERCSICPRLCGVNRLQGEVKFCGIGKEAIVSSFAPHFGEEPPLVGFHGSGTIFFAGCNLLCLYCQNHDISHLKQGEEVTPEQIASIMLSLQQIGCHNINFVTPTHVTPHILKAIAVAMDKGLSVPLVYNCGGYESVEILKLLDGVIDIYMPDMKYSDSKIAERLSDAHDYPEISQKALKEMHRQVGDLSMDERGIAQRGLLIRHLVLPEGQAGTEQIMKFIGKEISPDSYVNIMDQYRPCFKAHHMEGLNRRTYNQEFQEALDIARKQGLSRGF